MKIVKPTSITDNDWHLLTKKYKNMHRIIRKINNNYPVQYLIGNVNFYGYNIEVKKGVLIPRFETETLVEKTLALIKKNNLTNADVLELGTGSGCIAIALKKEQPTLNITTVEKYGRAYKIAKKNIKNNNVDIELVKADLFHYQPKKRYSVLISNPPYISYNEKIDEKCAAEPVTALYALDSGLVYYKYILNNYKQYLASKFLIAFEIGYQQGQTLKILATQLFPSSQVRIEKDLANKDRYLFIINE